MASKVIPIIEGERVLLRDYLPTDVDRFIYWQTHGEWLNLDAPWESSDENMTPEKEEKIRTMFMALGQQEQPIPRKRACMVQKEGLRSLGWVNYYGQERFAGVVYVGICICEDDALNRGVGTEALKLWVDYLFTNGNLHKIALDTWSFNPRMMHVAEKIGFKLEGVGREMIQWEGVWLDMMHYGLLRREWEKTPL